jgi:hypothetical protein
MVIVHPSVSANYDATNASNASDATHVFKVRLHTPLMPLIIVVSKHTPSFRIEKPRNLITQQLVMLKL